jgi:integrase
VIALPKLVKKEPAIFTIEQIERLFTTALQAKAPGVDIDGKRRDLPIYRRLLGFLALATFGGIRPFELTRLEVSAIDLEAGHVPLDAKVTKTNDRRVVELSENCVAWLRIWRAEFPEHKFAAPPSWDRLMKGLRGEAKLRPWPHDVLRHCFASYFHATHGDKARLQNQMGHSEAEDTLDRHYRAVRGPDGKPVTKEQAGKFWLVGPPGWKPAPKLKGKR